MGRLLAGCEARSERSGELPVRLQAFFHIHGGRGVLHLRAASASMRRNAKIREKVTKKNGESAKNAGCRATLAPVAVQLN